MKYTKGQKLTLKSTDKSHGGLVIVHVITAYAGGSYHAQDMHKQIYSYEKGYWWRNGVKWMEVEETKQTNE